MMSEEHAEPATVPDSGFRALTPAEEEDFRRWAREHATPRYLAKAGLYHPAVRDEWRRMGLRTPGYGGEDGRGPVA